MCASSETNLCKFLLFHCHYTYPSTWASKCVHSSVYVMNRSVMRQQSRNRRVHKFAFFKLETLLKLHSICIFFNTKWVKELNASGLKWTDMEKMLRVFIRRKSQNLPYKLHKDAAIMKMWCIAGSYCSNIRLFVLCGIFMGIYIEGTSAFRNKRKQEK